MNNKEIQMSESYILGIFLAVAGGFMDAYTFISRGGVFANAQTGNMVLFGINVANRNLKDALLYFIPVIAFAVGVLLAEFINLKFKQNTMFHWRQIILIIEIVVLFICGFIPSGEYNMLVNILVSFVCSLQATSFRKMRGLNYATTMCTGNLRSGTEMIFKYIKNKETEQLFKGMYYYGIIIFFIVGAAVGCVVTSQFGTSSIWISCALLIIALILMQISPQKINKR